VIERRLQTHCVHPSSGFITVQLNLSLNPDASPAAPARRPLAAG